MLRRRALRLLAGAGACAAGGVVASSEKRSEPSSDPDKRPIEILVHNISHSDMLVMLGEEGDDTRTFLARPVFNKFQPVSEAILDQISTLKVCASASAICPVPVPCTPSPNHPAAHTTSQHIAATFGHVRPRATGHGQAAGGRGGTE